MFMNSITPSAPPASAASPAVLLTPRQLSRQLNISRRCLTNWTRDRIVPMLKIGRVCRFDLAEVRAALARHTQPAASGSTGTTTTR